MYSSIESIRESDEIKIVGVLYTVGKEKTLVKMVSFEKVEQET